MTNEQNKPSNPPEVGNGNKRAYVKPTFRHEKVFEVMALACGKVGGTSSACNRNRKAS